MTSLKLAFIVILPICLCLVPGTLHPAADYMLPVYQLTIDEEYLDALDGNPWTSRTFPARIEIDGDSYSCHVRYRGTSARNLPKKSWKIYFDDEGPDGRKVTNLNAEYLDISLCRNYLGMKFYRLAGLPAPETDFISLVVNDWYAGVFVEIEQVDEDFLDRNDLPCGLLWKAIQHGARFVPMVRYEDILCSWEPEITPVRALDSLGMRFTFIRFADDASIADQIGNMIDIDNILTYFAIQYIVRNADGYTKNFYLYEQSDGRWSLIPWDMDGSIGNNWRGEWVDQYSSINSGFLDHQAVFQRLISFSQYRTEMLDIIEDLAANEIPRLINRLNAAYSDIRHDVYLDTAKQGSNDDFEREMGRLATWLQNRANVMRSLDWFNRQDVVSSSVEPEYIEDAGDSFRIRVTLDHAAYEVRAYIMDNDGEEYQFPLYDDGSHGDERANDLIFTRDISLPDAPSPFHYGIYVKPNQYEGSTWPPGGWCNFGNWPTPLPFIRIDENPPQHGDFRFTTFNRILETGTHYFGLVNITDAPVDISGCMISLGSSFRKMQLRAMPPIEPGDTLIITDNMDLIASMHPDCEVTGSFYFAPAVRDTVKLETYGGRLLSSIVVDEINEIQEAVGRVIINEINYNSADDFDPGDWIELYGLHDEHDLSNWILRDNRDDHVYEIPEGTELHEGEHMILARDISAFRECFPDVNPVIGNFDFGFAGNGDDVRLFDAGGILVDWVSYDDRDPWPDAPDGDGPTLELINPHCPNYGPLYWEASIDSGSHGTPGRQNSVFRAFNHTLPLDWGIDAVYPNPFNNYLFIRWSQYRLGNSRLVVFDLLGREVGELLNGRFDVGYHTVVWQAGDLPAGLYFLRLEHYGRAMVKRVVHLK